VDVRAAWLPPGMTIALVASSTALVMVGACAVMLVTRRRGIRATRDTLVVALLGPLVVAGSSGVLLGGAAGPERLLAVCLAGAALLMLTGLVAAPAAQRLERFGPPGAATTWSGASLLLAGLGRSLFGGRASGDWLAFAAVPIGLAILAAGVSGLARRRQRPPQTRFGRLLVSLTVAAAIAPFWPWLLPWMFYDRSLPELETWPPNFVFVAMEARTAPLADSLEPTPLVEALAVHAVTYPELSPDPDLHSLLTLPDGSCLAARLRETGYATAAVLTRREHYCGLGNDAVDDRPGGRRQLEESAVWRSGAPLLLGPASGLLPLLGYDRSLRSPQQVGGEASHWILGWRTERAPAPFFLLVDFRAPGTDAESIDAGLQQILDRLKDLQLDSITLLVVAMEQHTTRVPALRALVVPPYGWTRATRLEVAPGIWGRELSLALLRIATSNGESPQQLPGLAFALSPPPRSQMSGSLQSR
jgi:hypothetical protein